MRIRSSFLAALLFALHELAEAAPPNRLNFQGLGVDPGGTPINGAQTVTVRIWSDATSTAPGALLYAEVHGAVEFVDGVFDLAIGAGTPTTAALDPGDFAQADRFVEIQIASEVLSPRQRLASVPYALQCGNSESVSGFAGGSLITGVTAGAGLTGGGSAGDVTLSLAPNGVSSSQIVDGSITSADIAANTIASVDIALSSINSALIVDNAILPADIANEAGAAFMQGEGAIAMSVATTTVATLNLLAPSNGLIIANASLSATIDGETTTVNCGLTLNTTTYDDDAEVIAQGRGFIGASPMGIHPIGLTRGFVVIAPGTQVVRLLCRGGGFFNAATVFDRQLTAIFTPTAY